jgi:hypothetical protein
MDFLPFVLIFVAHCRASHPGLSMLVPAWRQCAGQGAPRHGICRNKALRQISVALVEAGRVSLIASAPFALAIVTSAAFLSWMRRVMPNWHFTRI